MATGYGVIDNIEDVPSRMERGRYRDSVGKMQCKVTEEDLAAEKVALLTHCALEQDMHGVVLCAVVRDIHSLATTSINPARIARVSLTMVIFICTLYIQIFLLYNIKVFVSAEKVHDIRIDYDTFEKHMYGEKHTTLTMKGKHRGIPGYFDPSRFESLPEDMKTKVCNIPFSQIHFFFVVLLLWTLICLQELKMCIYMFESLIVRTPNIASMRDSLEFEEDDHDSKIVAGLTLGVKLFLCFMVFLPRIAVDVYLLWLGCRWLLATNNFSELVLNSVALEFVLQLKELVYVALVPDRNKRDCESTKIRSHGRRELASIWVYANTFLLGIAALAWVYLYIHYFQQVLPGYKWDVHEVCQQWVEKRYEV